MIRVLMLSTDASIFDENSDVRERMKWYGTVFEELHIVVCATTKSKINPPTGGQKSKISENVFVYSTRSRIKFFALFDAYYCVKNIVEHWKLKIGNSRHDFVVTSQDPFELGLVAFLLKKKFSVPLQLQVHTDFLSPYFRRESLKNKVRVLLARFLLPRADGIRVVSERIKSSLSTLNIPQSTRVDVLPIFVEIEKVRATTITIDLHKKYPQFDFIILMASRLTPEKNIPIALLAMHEVARQFPRTGLVIVGDGPEKENLKLLTTNYNLQTNIIFEPAVDFQVLISYYKTADLFLLTSNYEGYGRTIIEAMGAGCPVVMTDAGIAGEILINRRTGFIIPVGETTLLVQKIIELRRHKEMCRYFQENFYSVLARLRDKSAYIIDYKSNIELLP